MRVNQATAPLAIAFSRLLRLLGLSDMHVLEHKPYIPVRKDDKWALQACECEQ